MKIVAMIPCLAGLMAPPFGTWGRLSPAGRTRFDEMAGMIPFFASYGGIAQVVLSGIPFGWLLLASAGDQG